MQIGYNIYICMIIFKRNLIYPRFIPQKPEKY